MEADLTGATLDGADASNAVFNQARLTCTRLLLRGAKLTHAIFLEADLGEERTSPRPR